MERLNKDNYDIFSGYRIRTDVPTDIRDEKVVRIRIYNGNNKVRDKSFELRETPTWDASKKRIQLARRDLLRVIAKTAELCRGLPYKLP